MGERQRCRFDCDKLNSLAVSFCLGLSAAAASRSRRLFAGGPSVSAGKSNGEGPDAEQLELEMRKIRAENERLRSELSAVTASGPTSTATAGSQASSSVSSPFSFPEGDILLALEFLRLMAPKASPQRSPEGDWLTLFRNAAPYISAFRGGTVVIHMPSFLLDDCGDGSFKGLMEDVAFCSILGLRLVLVTSVESRMLKRLNAAALQDATGKAGFVVDEAMLRVAKEEAGFARVEVESLLSSGFEKRILSGAGGVSSSAGIFSMRGAVSVVSSSNFFTASPVGVRDGVDYQYAGIVRSVNVELLQRRLQGGDIVSLVPLGASPSGEVFYVSSEALAASVAERLRAIKLVYITRGQRLIDTRVGRIIPGIQVHDAQAILGHLESHSNDYTPEDRSTEWFKETLRYLRLLVGAVSPKGVRRGHLVDSSPGALLQEFYTIDGSGTCIAQDLYQGLRRATLADSGAIYRLLEQDENSRFKTSPISYNKRVQNQPLIWQVAGYVEAGCAAGEFFVWKRDEVILGCGQLVAKQVGGELMAELRCLTVIDGCVVTHAPALLAYAEKAAVRANATKLCVSRDEVRDAERLQFLRGKGFCDGEDGNLFLRLGDEAESEAEQAIAAFSEQQRIWGGVE